MLSLLSGKGKKGNKKSGLRKNVGRVFHNLIYTDRGQIIISIILGLGLASIFRKYCEGKNCYKFIGPKHNSIRDEIYSYDSEKTKCYTLNEKSVKCDASKKIVEFA